MEKPATKKASKIGVKEGYERYTVITKTDIIEDLKGIAYFDRTTVTEISTVALSSYIEQWKAAHPGIKLRGGE